MGDAGGATAVPECAYDSEYGMVVLNYDGLAWGPPTTVDLVERVKDFPLDASDVVVGGFPKSGTNWLQIMLANLYDDWGTCAITEHRRVPQLEYMAPTMAGYETSIAADPPRLMKSHLPADRMPRAWRENRAKVIYLIRNPKDVCVSFYHQLASFLQGPDADWDLWVRRFAEGKTIYGPWLDHVLGWHRLGEADGVLNVVYEDMRAQPLAVMRKVVAFLGRPVEDAALTKVVEAAEFDTMKGSALVQQINVGGSREQFMRSGKVGDWRSRFTDAQSAYLDEKIIRPLERAGIYLDFG